MIRVLLLATLTLPVSAFADCRRSTPEPFAEFLNSFSGDKAFAVRRTEYPLRFYSHEDRDGNRQDGRVIVKHRVSKNDDSALPAMGVFARDNELEITTLSAQKRQATVQMGKPGTDWLYTYHFVRKSACWYLRRIENHSL